MKMQKRIKFYSVLVFVLLFVCLLISIVNAGQTSSSLKINAQAVGEPCVQNSGCTSNYCNFAAGVCGCVIDTDCPVSYACQSGLCFTSNLATEFSEYSQNTNVSITGNAFSYNGSLSLTVRNSVNLVVFGPAVIPLNATGGFNYVWNTTVNAVDNYSIAAVDLNRSPLSRNVSIQILPPFKFDVRIVDAGNNSLPSVVNISVQKYVHAGSEYHVDDENISTLLSYGVNYHIFIYPATGAIDRVFLDDFYNYGNISGELIGIDDVPETNSNFRSLDVKELFAVYPLFDMNYLSHYHVSFNYPALKNLALFKCLDWNFTARVCNTDATNWTFVKYVNSNGTDVADVWSAGDPGFAVVLTCGVDIDLDGDKCDANENPTTCPADCAVPSTGGSSSGRSGTTYIIVPPADYTVINNTVPENIKDQLDQGMKLLVPHIEEQFYKLNDSTRIYLKDQYEVPVISANVLVIKPDGEVLKLKTSEPNGTIMLNFDQEGVWKLEFNKKDYIGTKIEINVGVTKQIVEPFLFEKIKFNIAFLFVLILIVALLVAVLLYLRSRRNVHYKRTVMQDVLALKEKETEMKKEEERKKKEQKLASKREAAKQKKTESKNENDEAVDETVIVNTDEKVRKSIRKVSFIKRFKMKLNKDKSQKQINEELEEDLKDDE